MFQGRSTAQKTAIARVLSDIRDHPSASVIHERVRASIPNISLATVYRNLEAMAASGNLARICGAGEYRYDIDTRQHHHFFCLGCHNLLDMPEEAVGGVTLLYPETLNGCTITGAQLILFGSCSDCGSHLA